MASASRNGSTAGSMRGEWNAPATSSGRARTLYSRAASSASSSAPRSPDRTTWPGALSLATVTPAAWAIASASSIVPPSRASIEPESSASAISLPRSTTSSRASLSVEHAGGGQRADLAERVAGGHRRLGVGLRASRPSRRRRSRAGRSAWIRRRGRTGPRRRARCSDRADRGAPARRHRACRGSGSPGRETAGQCRFAWSSRSTLSAVIARLPALAHSHPPGRGVCAMRWGVAGFAAVAGLRIRDRDALCDPPAGGRLAARAGGGGRRRAVRPEVPRRGPGHQGAGGRDRRGRAGARARAGGARDRADGGRSRAGRGGAGSGDPGPDHRVGGRQRRAGLPARARCPTRPRRASSRRRSWRPRSCGSTR